MILTFGPILANTIRNFKDLYCRIAFLPLSWEPFPRITQGKNYLESCLKEWILVFLGPPVGKG